MADMLPVPGKEFVSSNTGQKHFHVSCRVSTNQERGNNRRVSDRLIHVPDQLRKKTSDIGVNDDFAMVTNKMLCRPRSDAGILRQLAAPVSLQKCDCLCLVPALNGFSHGCHNRT